MSTIRYSSEDVIVRSDEECLADIDAAIHAILSTGQSYTIFGSRVVTHSNLDELERMKARYERRLLYKKGHTGRNLANHAIDVADDANLPRA